MSRLISGWLCLVLLAGFPQLDSGSHAKHVEAKQWGYVRVGPVEVRKEPSRHHKAIAQLSHGALVAVLKRATKRKVSWSQVDFVSPDTFGSQIGWVESRQIDRLPLGQIPSDADVLKLVGGKYLDDFVSSQAKIARFLLRQGTEKTAMVCLLGAPTLPQIRLQVFFQVHGKFTPGPFKEFLFSDLRAGFKTIEVRDLLGNGDECLITHKAFNLGLEDHGVNMVILRVTKHQFQTLWEAPLEFSNLSAFPPRTRVLQPPEKNIGMPGTVTTGTVQYRMKGKISEPLWKGKVAFHVFGRELPVEEISLEKPCPWNGSKFAALR